jgi:hypothetical protein
MDTLMAIYGEYCDLCEAARAEFYHLVARRCVAEQNTRGALAAAADGNGAWRQMFTRDQQQAQSAVESLFAQACPDGDPDAGVCAYVIARLVSAALDAATASDGGEAVVPLEIDGKDSVVRLYDLCEASRIALLENARIETDEYRYRGRKASAPLCAIDEDTLARDEHRTTVVFAWRKF